MNSLVVVKACEDPGVLKAMSIGQLIVQIIFIIVPVILIIMMIFDSAKAIASKEADMKTLLKSMFSRIASCALLMLTPTLVQFAVSLVSDNSVTNMTACFENVKNIEHFEQKYKEELAKEQKERDKKRAEKEKEKYDLTLYEIAQDAANNNNSNTGITGTFVGSTYNLSNDDLRWITNACINEQSSVEGTRTEASVMANLYELNGSNYGSIRNYVENGGWFNVASYDQETITDKHLAAVKDVLVNGNRNVPFYVDEHDCIWCGDIYGYNIKKIVTDGKEINISTNEGRKAIRNHKNYEPEKTIIYNTSETIYTFYMFPDDESDPFGYKESSYKAYKKLNKGD